MLSTIITQSAARGIELELYFLSRLADDALVRIPQLAGDITYLDTQVFCRQWYRDEQRLEWECAPESHANYEEPAGYWDDEPCDCGAVLGPRGFFVLHEAGSHPNCQGTYSCGAAYCDEPRCTTHSPRFADWR